MARIAENRDRRNRRIPGEALPPSRRAGTQRGGAKGSRRPWFADKGPVLRFVLIFGGLMAAFNLFFYTGFSKTDGFNSYLAWNAKVSAAVLGLLGDEATVSGVTLSSPRFALSLEAGCDALQASAFFVFAVLASPISVSLTARLAPLALGMAVLLAFNVVRIISLYYTGVYFPKAFETMHIDVWQALYIFLPIFFWIVWSRWAMRHKELKPDVAT